jgi:hypothetical protein
MFNVKKEMKNLKLNMFVIGAEGNNYTLDGRRKS